MQTPAVLPLKCVLLVKVAKVCRPTEREAAAGCPFFLSFFSMSIELRFTFIYFSRGCASPLSMLYLFFLPLEQVATTTTNVSV